MSRADFWSLRLVDWVSVAEAYAHRVKSEDRKHDARTARVMALTYNLRRSRKMPRRTPEDFMPKAHVKRRQTPEQMYRAVKEWNKILA